MSKVNDNLSEMAQTIYESWFIDFKPFRSSYFIPTDIGEIPNDWDTGKLSDLVTIKYGKDHKKLSDGSIPVFGSGGIMRYADTSIYHQESVLIPRKGTLNNVIYVNEPFWSVDTMFYTEMRSPNLAKYVFHFVKSKDLASMNAGSAVPSMTTDILNNLLVIIPPQLVLSQFEELVSPMYIQIKANLDENNNLSKLRDVLLPKLMTGEIDVSQVTI